MQGPSSPGDLTCLEDCPDVCVQNRGKWVRFLAQGREWRDPLNGCKINQPTLYWYTLQLAPSLIGGIFDQKLSRPITMQFLYLDQPSMSFSSILQKITNLMNFTAES